MLSTAGTPVTDIAGHTVGNIRLAVTNNGTFGTYGSPVPDPYTGELIPSCEFPKNSDLVYLWVAAVWIGAIVGRDTLVSTGTEDYYQSNEFWPDVKVDPTVSGFESRSINMNSTFYSELAYSEEDLICSYTDTISIDNLTGSDETDGRGHKPIGLKIDQRSMAWSYSYAEDFILFDYQITNTGVQELEDVYIGIWVDGDAWHVVNNGPQGWNDDLVGFYPTHPAPEGCGFLDTINVAYHMDNDGDPDGSVWDFKSIRGALGTRVVRTPAEDLKYSFNWWIIDYSGAAFDFGPRRAGTEDDPYRRFGSRLGTPLGDRNKYYVLRHEEFDYDQLFTAKNHTLEGWMPPPSKAAEFAWGWDMRYLLSFGPFNIKSGDRLPVSFSIFGADNVHQNPTDHADLFDPNDPDLFYSSLDFSELADNSRWSSWIYDNPGVDTDGDGYFGKFRICQYDSVIYLTDTNIIGVDTNFIDHYEYTDADTNYYEGDGVPDFRGAGPPPTPVASVFPTESSLTVRFNGYYSENSRDPFSQVNDFEGYRIYIGRDDRTVSLSLLSSYDIEDYNRYRFKKLSSGTYGWGLEDIPFRLDSLRTMYNNPDFDPLRYSPSAPLRAADGEAYYFEAQDYNNSSLVGPGNINKVFPDASNPGTDSSLWIPADLTDEGLPKFFEYEYVINDLLPTVPYYVAVTTFDFGSPVSGLPALESSPHNNIVMEYTIASADYAAAHNLEIFCYPNPYRGDADYGLRGFEDGSGVLSRDRARLINFVNLPLQCVIRIYSLDGDLVREIIHSKQSGEPLSGHDSWNLITRNTQAAVAGLYYWTVESDSGIQIGKLVIID